MPAFLPLRFIAQIPFSIPAPQQLRRQCPMRGVVVPWKATNRIHGDAYVPDFHLSQQAASIWDVVTKPANQTAQDI